MSWVPGAGCRVLALMSGVWGLGCACVGVQVGLLRCGRMVVEACPADILDAYGGDCLEDAVQRLCAATSQVGSTVSQHLQQQSCDKNNGHLTLKTVCLLYSVH